MPNIKIPRNEIWGIPAAVTTSTLAAIGLYWVFREVLGQPPFFANVVVGVAWFGTMIALAVGCAIRYKDGNIPTPSGGQKQAVLSIIVVMTILGLPGALCFFLGLRAVSSSGGVSPWLFVSMVLLGISAVFTILKLRRLIKR